MIILIDLEYFVASEHVLMQVTIGKVGNKLDFVRKWPRRSISSHTMPNNPPKSGQVRSPKGLKLIPFPSLIIKNN